MFSPPALHLYNIYKYMHALFSLHLVFLFQTRIMETNQSTRKPRSLFIIKCATAEGLWVLGKSPG